MTATKKYRMLSSNFFVLFLLLCTSLNLAYAQDHVKENAAEQTSLSGWFSIMWGDSDDGKSSMTLTLTDANGQQTVLQLDETVAIELGGVYQFNGKYVNLQGNLATPSYNGVTAYSDDSPPAVLNVISISLAPSSESLAPTINGVVAQAISGSHPWVTIMCKFSDIPDEPHDVAYFQDMYGNTWPGLNHYWKELSFNTVDIAGSAVGGIGWYDLPNTELHYNPTDTAKMADKEAVRQDCIAAVDADVDFSLYDGINIMLNSDYDNGWAWGNPIPMTLDGDNRTWAVTWNHPAAQNNIRIIAHEMGHGFGLPHSTAPGGGVYDNPWDVMSKSNYNCAATNDGTYGCIGQHTISYYKDLMGWIPGPRKTTVAVGSIATVTLEDLAAPASSNYQMVTIPIGGSATNFYTVEARRLTSYDAKLPEEAVVIHDVDSTDISDSGPALLVPDGVETDAWTAGERFIDATNDIAVIVNTDTGTGFNVTISNGNLPPTSDANGPYTAECQGTTTSLTLDGTGSSDPDIDDDLTFSWSSDCPDATFDDNTSPTPELTLTSSAPCQLECEVTLTVTDTHGLSDTYSADVIIEDSTEPDLACPADDTIECDELADPSNTGSATATDNCDPDPVISFSDVEAPGACPQEKTITRTWTATDACSNSISCDQIIIVQDTTSPVITCNALGTIIPPDAPISFTATAVDNCDSNPTVVLVDFDCFKFTKKDKRIDKTESCNVQVDGDTITILDSGGVGDRIEWTVEATDACGNVEEVTCGVDVVNPAK
ncbi:MAG: hypothetical protein GY941_14905 [Planctomycetes bacterium]|nr:hypothetical protein [Planctomycetota bacterium]